MKASEKEEPTQISIWRSLKLLFSLSDHCQVFKGSKKAVLGKIRTHWAPRESPKDLEVCEKEILAIKSNKAGCFVLFWSLLGCHGALRSFSPS